VKAKGAELRGSRARRSSDSTPAGRVLVETARNTVDPNKHRPIAETPRQAIRRHLAAAPHTAHELSALVHLPEKDIVPHLEHLARSVRGSGVSLEIEPARCSAAATSSATAGGCRSRAPVPAAAASTCARPYSASPACRPRSPPPSTATRSRPRGGRGLLVRPLDRSAGTGGGKTSRTRPTSS